MYGGMFSDVVGMSALTIPNVNQIEIQVLSRHKHYQDLYKCLVTTSIVCYRFQHFHSSCIQKPKNQWNFPALNVIDENLLMLLECLFSNYFECKCSRNTFYESTLMRVSWIFFDCLPWLYTYVRIDGCCMINLLWSSPLVVYICKDRWMLYDKSPLIVSPGCIQM